MNHDPKFLPINWLDSIILNGTDVLALQKDMIVTIIHFWEVSPYFPAHIVNHLCSSCEITCHFS